MSKLSKVQNTHFVAKINAAVAWQDRYLEGPIFIYWCSALISFEINRF